MARWKTAVAATLVVAALGSACGDDDEDAGTTTRADGSSSSVSTTIGDAGGSEGGGTAVPETTAQPAEPAEPIKVGITMIDFEALRAVNVATDWGDQELIWQTLIDAINESGGILGAPIEPHFREYSVIDPASAETACVALAQDEGVFAVLSGFTGPAESANVCFADNGVAQFSTSPDPEVAATVPWVSAETDESRRLAIWADLVVEEGVLDGKTFAVIAFEQRLADVEANLLPSLAAAGYEPAEVFVTTTSGDLPATLAAYDVWAERISVEGIDHVMLIDDALIGATYLRQRGYEGELSIEWATPPGGQLPPEDFPPLIGMQDVGIDQGFESPVIQECVSVFEEANPEIGTVRKPGDVPDGEENWGNGIRVACTFLDLFRVTLEAAGEPTNEALLEAITTNMSDFEFGPNPYASFGPGKFDANDGFRIVEFDPTQGASGGYVGLTELVEIVPD